METQGDAHPRIVDRETWLWQRRELLGQEKALMELMDRVNARRRRMPMVKLDKPYHFRGRDGEFDLRGLFGNMRQLIVYHFMFDPAWDKGCPGCSGLVDALGDLSMLEKRNTRFVLVSRAPLEKLETFRRQRGWDRPWYSSHESDFNYDFHATYDAGRAALMVNFRSAAEQMAIRGRVPENGETHGISVFFRIDDDVYHTYSSYQRGVENLTDSYALLDITPWGRQEDFEDSPPGWPQKPTYG